MQVVPELLERNFGAYELQSDDNYAKVWDADARSLHAAAPGGGESVEQVQPLSAHTVTCGVMPAPAARDDCTHACMIRGMTSRVHLCIPLAGGGAGKSAVCQLGGSPQGRGHPAGITWYDTHAVFVTTGWHSKGNPET